MLSLDKMKIDWKTKKYGNIEVSTFAAITPKGVVINPEYQNEYNDYKKKRLAEMLVPLIMPNCKRNKNGKLNKQDSSNRYFIRRAMSEDLQFLEEWYNHEQQKRLTTPAIQTTGTALPKQSNQKPIDKK